MRTKYLSGVTPLVLIFVITRITALLCTSETPSLFLNHYEQAALNLLHGKGLTVYFEGTLVPLTLYPPGYSLFIAGVYELFGANPLFVRLVQCGIAVLATVLFTKTIEAYFASREKALRFGYFYALIPLFWVHDTSLNTGASLAISCSLIGFFFLNRPVNIANTFLSGLFLAMAVSVRSEFLILMPVFLLFLLFKADPRIRALGYVIGCLSILASMSARNYTNFGVLTPLPGGAGLTMINVIGKFYPDYGKGFAFGDANVLKAEKGNYKDLTYPSPYERDKDRLDRSLEFIRNHPDKYLLVLVKNTPRAWFGQQLNIAPETTGFQEHLANGGTFTEFIKTHPLKFLDIAMGFTISVVLMALAGFWIASSNAKERLLFLPFISSALMFLIFSIFMGALGRYTLPAFVYFSPLSYLGLVKFLSQRKARLNHA